MRMRNLKVLLLLLLFGCVSQPNNKPENLLLYEISFYRELHPEREFLDLYGKIKWRGEGNFKAGMNDVYKRFNYDYDIAFDFIRVQHEINQKENNKYCCFSERVYTPRLGPFLEAGR
jgi:hypothetical protein